MEGTYYSCCISSFSTLDLRVLYYFRSPLTQKSVEAPSFLYTACSVVTRVEPDKFHSQAVTLRQQLNFCRKAAAMQKVLPVLLGVSSSWSFLLMPKKTSLHQAVWASPENQFDLNSTEILSEPETALEGLDNQSGCPHTLCTGAQTPRAAGKSRALWFTLWALVCQFQTMSQPWFHDIFPETWGLSIVDRLGEIKVHIFCITFITIVFNRLTAIFPLDGGFLEGRNCVSYVCHSYWCLAFGWLPELIRVKCDQPGLMWAWGPRWKHEEYGCPVLPRL